MTSEPSTSSSPSVGVIGLGIIGSRSAENLRRSGRTVYVWNRSPRPVPNFLGSPAEVAQVTKLIQLYARDSDALIEITEAMRDALTHEHVVVNHGTVSLDATRKAASIVQGAAAAFLDCPFTGSKVAAQNGELVYYVGGNKDVLDSIRPALEVTSKEILHCGEIGHATILKIATNMISAATVEVLAEALAVTRAHGVAGEKLAAALDLNACKSVLTSMKLPAMLSEDYDTHFSLKNMLKDSRLALDLARKAKLAIPVLAQTEAVMAECAAGGDADADYAAVARRFTRS